MNYSLLASYFIIHVCIWARCVKLSRMEQGLKFLVPLFVVLSEEMKLPERRPNMQLSRGHRGLYNVEPCLDLTTLYRRECFVWVDESGRKSIRHFGYSLIRLLPVCHCFHVRGRRISALLGVELTTGSVNRDKFFDFVRGTLIPNMNPFDGVNDKSIVLMDNCSIHHVIKVR